VSAETDGFEARITYYANFPRRTHRVVCDGETIGHIWSDGTIEIDDPPPTAPQVRAALDG
jgi:hypothetical protein